MKRFMLLTALMLLIVSASVGCGQTTDTLTMVEEWAMALRTRDQEKTMSFYGDDIIWEDAATKDHVTGKPELTSMVIWLFALPDVKWDVTSSFVSGDGKWAATEWVWSGTNAGQGYSITGVSILEIRDGKIVRETIYYDRTSSPY
jgi:steroid delta-isomerase-like uncharacterized protein